MTIPQSLTELPYGQRLTSILEKNSLFKEKPPQGLVLVVDLTGKQMIQNAYNPDNWQLFDKKPENILNPNYAATIIVASQLISPDEIERLINELKPKIDIDGGEIFIYETGLQIDPSFLPQIKDERQTIFSKAGLIKFKASPTQKPSKNTPLINELLTQARFKKIAEHHPHEIDLLSPRADDPAWKKRWRKNIIPGIIAMYQALGFEKVDTSSIEERLHHSKNPPVDLAKARDGFGVEAKASCGCHIRVDLDGAITVLNHCPDHKNGIPEEKVWRQKKEITYKIGETILEQVCFDCGANLIQTIQRYRGNTALFKEIRCPHCGLLSTKRL
jgi:DNA-directed RNA polymerase subunit RPC12/RpoP